MWSLPLDQVWASPSQISISDEVEFSGYLGEMGKATGSLCVLAVAEAEVFEIG